MPYMVKIEGDTFTITALERTDSLLLDYGLQGRGITFSKDGTIATGSCSNLAQLSGLAIFFEYTAHRAVVKEAKETSNPEYSALIANTISTRMNKIIINLDSNGNFTIRRFDREPLTLSSPPFNSIEGLVIGQDGALIGQVTNPAHLQTLWNYMEEKKSFINDYDKLAAQIMAADAERGVLTTVRMNKILIQFDQNGTFTIRSANGVPPRFSNVFFQDITGLTQGANNSLIGQVQNPKHREALKKYVEEMHGSIDNSAEIIRNLEAKAKEQSGEGRPNELTPGNTSTTVGTSNIANSGQAQLAHPLPEGPVQRASSVGINKIFIQFDQDGTFTIRSANGKHPTSSNWPFQDITELTQGVNGLVGQVQNPTHREALKKYVAEMRESIDNSAEIIRNLETRPERQSVTSPLRFSSTPIPSSSSSTNTKQDDAPSFSNFWSLFK